jgi:hypothetical protein
MTRCSECELHCITLGSGDGVWGEHVAALAYENGLLGRKGSGDEGEDERKHFVGRREVILDEEMFRLEGIYGT